MSKNRCPKCDGYAPLISPTRQQCSDCGYLLTGSESCPEGPCYGCEHECGSREEDYLYGGSDKTKASKTLVKRMLDLATNPHGDLGPKIKCWMEGDRICAVMEIPPGVLADHVVLKVEE